MEDIEDMFKGDDAQMETRRPVKTILRKNKPKVQAKKQEPEEVLKKANEIEEHGQCAAVAPGTQSVFVKTYGCSHNISDSEYMAGLLADYGYKIVDDMERADACLLNSCTVKNPS